MSQNPEVLNNIKQSLENSEYRQLEFYKPHPKQELFHLAGEKCDERLFLAGNRTGKTHSGAMEVTYHLTGLYPKWWKGRRFDKPVTAWAASDTAESTRNILQVKYLGGLKEHEYGKGTIPRDCLLPGSTKKYEITMRQGISDAVDTVSIRHVSGGTSYLSFKSYDQGRGKFQGTTLDLAHLDEEPPWDVYEECLIRLMGTSGKRGGTMLLTMTPLLGQTEVVLQFITDREPEKIERGRYYVQATWQDATHLSEEEVAKFESAIPEHMLEARSKGIPSIGEGKVYPVAESLISCPRFPIPDYYRKCYGMDFGWNPDPTVAIFGAIDPDTDILYLYHEFKINEATPKDVAAMLTPLGADWIPGFGDPFGGRRSSEVDGKKIIDRYREAGLNIEPAEALPKLNGIMTVLEYMNSGKLKVFDDLKGWWTEFRMYAYNQKGQPNDKNDHFMDTTRYLITSGISKAINPAQSDSIWFQSTRKLRDWKVI